MKRKLLLSLSVAVIAISMASCTVTKATNRTINAYDSQIIVKPLLAEVEVDLNKKINGTASARKMPVREVKELAKWDALSKSGADIIIDPVYKITTSGLFKWNKMVTVEVIGFYGKYTDISIADAEDLKQMELYNIPSGGGSGSSGGGGGILSKLKKLK